MSSFKQRLTHVKAKLVRRASGTPTERSMASSRGSERAPAASSVRKSVSLTKLPEVQAARVEPPPRDSESASADQPAAERSTEHAEDVDPVEHVEQQRAGGADDDGGGDDDDGEPKPTAPSNPQIQLEEPTPLSPPVEPAHTPPATGQGPAEAAQQHQQHQQQHQQPDTTTHHHHHPLHHDARDLSHHQPSPRHNPRPPPPDLVRRQSLVAPSDAHVINRLLTPAIQQHHHHPQDDIAGLGPLPPAADDCAAAPFDLRAMHRKIWVKRPNGSATLVQIREDAVVDDVRDMILRKYANSLGRSFDSPDITMRIVARDDGVNPRPADRTLGPEEDMCRTLDAYYPAGQTVHNALIIDVPQRRTPKPSPRAPLLYSHHDDAHNAQSEYFPPMPANPSPAALAASTHSAHSAHAAHDSRLPLNHAPHSIAVLATGQLPPLPSPGASSRKSHHSTRPRYPRHNTASPTALSAASTAQPAARPGRQRHDSNASDAKQSATGNPAIPTPPALTDPNARQISTPTTPRLSSPRPDKERPRKPPKVAAAPSLPVGLLDNSVPPINVLIVEDNIISMRVLGAFMQRLKVRWQRAMNGKEAVDKWRSGGFHLVLMDIQLPIMNGLEATKEIRRLERVNSIGVFSSGSSEAPNNRLGNGGQYEPEVQRDDVLGDKGLFKSPVIIVALTASSAQSDRHEALAAGCNDFLTKPVNFVWLERKVKEWGCMQALIDYEGWKKWKDFATEEDENSESAKLPNTYANYAPKTKAKGALSAPSATSATAKSGPTTANGVTAPARSKDEEKKGKRRSVGVAPPSMIAEESSTSIPGADD